MRISRRAALWIMGAHLAVGLAGRAGAQPAAGRRYRLHVSGMT